jgi:hypothetical protein
VVEGRKRLPMSRPPDLPRMADFAQWAMACETALWPAGTFGAAYKCNCDDAIEAVIEADPVAATVRTLMQTRTVWTGTATLVRAFELISSMSSAHFYATVFVRLDGDKYAPYRTAIARRTSIGPTPVWMARCEP